MADRDIRDAVLQITGLHRTGQVYIIDASVISVDLSARTCVCQVVSGKANNIINNVRLMANVDDGFLIIPQIDSNVCIIMSDFTEPYISQYSGIDKIVFRGGDLSGLIAIVALTAKLNGLVATLQTELTKIATGIAAAGSTYVPGAISQFIKDDYENKSITHG